ncbi:MAG: hypothetical protein LUE29_05025 [Lachnospiraceae bacterium]|nr:hypothetical protein [Lachnospiraceae bacterium]
MKKFFMTATGVFLIFLLAGLMLRRGYTEIRFQDPEVLADFVRSPFESEEGYEGSYVEPYTVETDYGTMTYGGYTEGMPSQAEQIREELDGADIVVKARATGDVRILAGVVCQTVQVEEVLRGEVFREKLTVISQRETVTIDGELKVLGGYTNWMTEDGEYLVFLKEYSALAGKYYLADGAGVGYFALTDVENEIVEYHAAWACGAENEFFACTQEALQDLLDIKRENLKKFGLGG